MKRTWLTLGLAASAISAQAAWDLKADWSDSMNPNGAWTYREGSNALPHVNSWQSSLGGWSQAQPGWADSENGNDRIPFWFKSNGAETFAHDWLAGDVVVHTQDEFSGIGNGQANLTWTAASTDLYDVNGVVWFGRDIGRAVDWQLLLNGSAVLDSGSLFSGDSFSRAAPDTITASSVLMNAGDHLELRFVTVGQAGDFVGMNMSVEAVPEPTTMAVLAAGLGLALRRRRFGAL